MKLSHKWIYGMLPPRQFVWYFPAEAHNVASQYPELGADLKNKTCTFLNQYCKTTKAPPKRYAKGVETFLLAD